mmetsp:Transcript_14488/g.21806  ORF Transcript_14488/g.21806 Transcript_14488/m.21806 type:complete len:245 (+) Transcript_14488:997-1731(+)
MRSLLSLAFSARVIFLSFLPRRALLTSPSSAGLTSSAGAVSSTLVSAGSTPRSTRVDLGACHAGLVGSGNGAGATVGGESLDGESPWDAPCESLPPLALFLEEILSPLPSRCWDGPLVLLSEPRPPLLSRFSWDIVRRLFTSTNSTVCCRMSSLLISIFSSISTIVISLDDASTTSCSDFFSASAKAAAVSFSLRCFLAASFFLSFSACFSLIYSFSIRLASSRAAYSCFSASVRTRSSVPSSA